MNSPADSAILEAAIAWRIKLHHNEADTDAWTDFQRWLHISPEHAQVWERLQRMGERLQPPMGSLSGSDASHILRQAQEQQRRRSRRKMLLSLGIFGASGVLAWRISEAPFVQSLLADAATPVGERRRLSLPDGGVLVLNTDTAVNIVFNAQWRRIELLSGEIYLISGQDPLDRPLFVQTRDGRAQALGTRYRVRQFETGSQVEVNEGSVALWPRDHQGTEAFAVLQAGQSACMTLTGVESVPTQLHNMAVAWVDGALSVRDMPLVNFLQELARYHGVIECAPSVADIKVSGVFQLENTGRVLDLLRQSLPIEVQLGRQWWGGRVTRVVARS